MNEFRIHDKASCQRRSAKLLLHGAPRQPCRQARRQAFQVVAKPTLRRHRRLGISSAGMEVSNAAEKIDYVYLEAVGTDEEKICVRRQWCISASALRIQAFSGGRIRDRAHECILGYHRPVWEWVNVRGARSWPSWRPLLAASESLKQRFDLSRPCDDGDRPHATTAAWARQNVYGENFL